MTSSHWQRLWSEWPKQFDQHDYLRQVGKTVDGDPIGVQQVDLIVSEISSRLQLRSSDALLDLCCGNGLLTARLADRSGEVVGVDFSKPLLTIATRDHGSPRTRYVLGSVLDIPGLDLPRHRFNKVVMYDSLQYFGPAQLSRVLTGLAPLLRADRLIVLGGVLYQPHRDRLLTTKHKLLSHLYRRLRRRDLLGRWWSDDDFRRALRPLGLNWESRVQRPELYNSGFRIDVAVW